ncbi:MAG: 3-isopropylmalate dehydrogenase, partial [Actinobacteria bacterium]|nr:3-isopropylmalate dehydrogenase [Actinomycetota bacterium]
KADPTATVLSLAMLLEHVGQNQAAMWVEAAVSDDLASRGDSVRSTSAIGDALAAGAASKAK